MTASEDGAGDERAAGPEPIARKAVRRPRVRLTPHERRWAPLAHAASIPGFFLGLGFVGPLLVGRFSRTSSPFVRHHVKQAVNFNFTVALAVYASFLVLVWGTADPPKANEPLEPQWIPAAGLSMLILLLVYWFMFTVRAMISTSYGEWHRYPPSLRLMR